VIFANSALMTLVFKWKFRLTIVNLRDGLLNAKSL